MFGPFVNASEDYCIMYKDEHIGLYGVRLYGMRLYGTRLYGGAVQNRTLRRGDLKKQDSTAATKNVPIFD